MATQTLYLSHTASAVCVASAVNKLITTAPTNVANAGIQVASGNSLTARFTPGTAANTTPATPGSNVNTAGYLYDAQTNGTYAAGTWTIEVVLEDTAIGGGTETFTAYVFVVTTNGSTVTKVSEIGHGTSSAFSQLATGQYNASFTFSGASTVVPPGSYIYIEVYAAANGGSVATNTLSLYTGSIGGPSPAAITTPNFNIGNFPTATDTLNDLLDYDTAVLADAPLHYYKLNETSGTTAADSSGNSHNATYVGTVNTDYNLNATPGPIVNYADGTYKGLATANSHAISAPNPGVASGTSYTLEAWIYPTSFATALAIAAPSGLNPGFGLATKPGSSAVTLVVSAQTANTLHANTAVSLNKWSHVVMVFDSTVGAHGQYRLYLNAQLDGQLTLTLANLQFNAAYWWGQYNSAVNPFVGQLARCAFYTSALSQADISLHYVSGRNIDFLDWSLPNVALGKTATDTLASIAETAVRNFYRQLTASDNFNATFSDFAGTPQCFFLTAADTITGVSDSVSRALQALLRTPVDFVNVPSETATRHTQAFTRSSTDTASSPTDAAVRYTGRYPMGADTLGALSDSGTRTLVQTRVVSDTLASLTDAAIRIAQAFTRTGADTVAALTDSATHTFGAGRVASDSLTLVTDSASRAAQAFLRTVLDVVDALSDAAFQGTQKHTSVTAADAVAVPADTASKAVGMPRSAADTLAVLADSAVRAGLRLMRLGADTIATPSSVAMRAVFLTPRLAADTVAPPSDALARVVSSLRAITDSFGASFADSVSGARTLMRTAADNVAATFSDIASRNNQWIRQAADTLAQISETLVVPRILRMYATDTFPTFVDFASPFKYIIVSATDTLPQITTIFSLIIDPILAVYNFGANCGQVVVQVIEKFHGSDNSDRACSCDPNDADLTGPPT